VHYYDDYEPDYDSLDYHNECGYHESLAEEGLQACHCGEVYGEDDENCPKCARIEAVHRRIESGELEADAICYACNVEESATSFMGQNVCWDCYKAIARGEHKPDRCEFAHPGSGSALRAAGPGNPRVHPCPNCREPNVLTPQDVARGYQCDSCADALENPWAP